MYEIIRQLCAALKQGRPAAVATVVFQSGSTPRGPGSKLLANADGLLAGTVGGGISEAQTLLACRRALASGRSEVLKFALDGSLAAQSDMICGGQLQILVEPFFPDSAPLALLQELADCLRVSGGLLARPFPPGSASDLILCHNGTVTGGQPSPVLAEALPAHDHDGADGWRKQASLREIGGRLWFVEPCRQRSHMILAGGGHVAQATAAVAAVADFSVSVLDDRPEFVSPERFPFAQETRHVPGFRDCFAPYVIGPETYLVIVTRGHLFDRDVLAQALRTSAGYIGMIGSVRKREALYAALRSDGFGDVDFRRVHCPIGLSIGAETPAEIAVSIVAECIAHKRNN